MEVSFYSKLKVTAHKHWLKLSDDNSATHEEKQKAKEEFQKARQMERKIKRKFLINLEEERNSDLFSILSQNPTKLFQRLKQNKTTSVSIHELKVGDQTYTGESVPDGFFESLSKLKSVDYSSLEASSSTFQTFSDDFQNIKKICEEGKSIPKISIEKTSKILHKIRPHVNDFFSITALHYVNGGSEAELHFFYLLNAIIDNINNSIDCKSS